MNNYPLIVTGASDSNPNTDSIIREGAYGILCGHETLNYLSFTALSGDIKPSKEQLYKLLTLLPDNYFKMGFRVRSCQSLIYLEGLIKDREEIISELLDRHYEERGITVDTLLVQLPFTVSVNYTTRMKDVLSNLNTDSKLKVVFNKEGVLNSSLTDTHTLSTLTHLGNNIKSFVGQDNVENKFVTITREPFTVNLNELIRQINSLNNENPVIAIETEYLGHLTLHHMNKYTLVPLLRTLESLRLINTKVTVLNISKNSDYRFYFDTANSLLNREDIINLEKFQTDLYQSQPFSISKYMEDKINEDTLHTTLYDFYGTNPLTDIVNCNNTHNTFPQLTMFLRELVEHYLEK